MKRTFAYRDGKVVEITKGWQCTETFAILDAHSLGRHTACRSSGPVFVKARHKFASHDGKWEYFAVHLANYADDQEEALKEWAIEFCAKYDYSERYRGCDYEIVQMPPHSWLRDQVRWLQAACEAYQATITKYQGMLEATTDEPIDEE